MSQELSPHLSLPYLSSAQAQKHVTVNESLRLLSAFVQLSILSDVLVDQPTKPENGDRYIIPDNATGAAWGEFSKDSLVFYTDNQWIEISPQTGWLAFNVVDQSLILFNGSEWVSLSIFAGTAMLTKIIDTSADGSYDASNALALEPREKMDIQIDVTATSGSITPIVTLYARLDSSLPWVQIDEVNESSLVTHHWHPYIRAVVTDAESVIHVQPV